MTIAYFLELTGSAEPSGESLHESLPELRNRLHELPAVQCIDLFTAEASHDPFLDDGAGPALLLQLRLADRQALAQLLDSPALQQLLTDLKTLPLHHPTLQQEAMKLECFDVPEANGAPGAIAYLVNYQRPAEDEYAFLDYYRARHPPILCRFAGLRSLELGLPIGWCPLENLPWANRMLFCEVSFDSIEALDAALASEIRKELRRDFATFPPFSGPVTHHAMRRQRIVPAHQ
jgi:uncharacterized protein (TIGR02118 family)